MSEKMKRALEKPVKTKIVEQHKSDVMINNLLNESVRIGNRDKEYLYQYIERPGNRVFYLDSYRDTYEQQDRKVTIARKSGNMVSVTFLSEFVEFQDILIEMCDSMDWPFKSNVDGELVSFTIFPR